LAWDCKIPAGAAWQEVLPPALENASREALPRVLYNNFMLLKQTYPENFPVDTAMYRKNNEQRINLAVYMVINRNLVKMRRRLRH
jgi:hypothetical protein